MAKKSVFLLPIASFSLLSCGGNSSSSSAPRTYSSPTSSSVAPKPAGGLSFNAGTIAAHAKAESENTSLDFTTHISDLSFNAKTSLPMEGMSQLFDYAYYQEAYMVGEASFSSIKAESRNGDYVHTDVYSPKEEKPLRFATNEGSLYADLSSIIERSEEGPAKYQIQNAFEFLNEETFVNISAVLSMFQFDAMGLLGSVDDNPVLSEALHASSEEAGLKITLDLSSEVMAEVAALFKTDLDKEGFKATIDSYIPRMEDASLTTFVDMKTGSFDTIQLGGLFGVKDFSEEIKGKTYSLTDIYFDLDASIKWSGEDEFSLPDLSDYTLINPQQEQE